MGKDSQEAVVRAPDMLVRMEEESDEAAVTGQMVVYTAMVLVVTTVWTASVPRLEARLEMAAVSPAPGQLVTDGAHEMMVLTVVAATVRVVWEPLTKGAGAVMEEPAVAAVPDKKPPPVPLTPTPGLLAAAAAVEALPPSPVTDPEPLGPTVPLPAAGGADAWAVMPPVAAGPEGTAAPVVVPLKGPPGPMAEPLGLPPAPKAVAVAEPEPETVAEGVCSAVRDADETSEGKMVTVVVRTPPLGVETSDDVWLAPLAGQLVTLGAQEVTV